MTSDHRKAGSCPAPSGKNPTLGTRCGSRFPTHGTAWSFVSTSDTLDHYDVCDRAVASQIAKRAHCSRCGVCRLIAFKFADDNAFIALTLDHLVPAAAHQK